MAPGAPPSPRPHSLQATPRFQPHTSPRPTLSAALGGAAPETPRPNSLIRFRAAVDHPDILLPQPLRAQINMPTSACGVSLAWLRAFIDACSKVVDVHDTHQVMHAVVTPITRPGHVRLWDLVPPAHRGPPGYYVIHTWSDSLDHVITQVATHLMATKKAAEDAIAAAMEAAQPRASSESGDTPETGASSDDDESASGSEAGGNRNSSEKPANDGHTAVAWHNGIQPHDGPLAYGGRTSHGGHRSCEASMDGTWQRRSTPLSPMEQLMHSTYVWIDVVAMCQHSRSGGATVLMADLEEVRTAIMAATRGSIMVLDPELTMLSRCWCMFETWATVYHGDCQRLQVVFPDELTLEDFVEFQYRVRAIDLSKAQTTKPADKQRIMAEVKHKVGLSRFHILLPDAVLRSTRTGLRWSGYIAKVSMYCAMLLKSQELYQVQTTLHSIAEIHDDEKMLQDIRDVFRVMDSDGSGELDEDEFVQVLCMAGFTKQEGHKIFLQVDVDCGGSVSLEEFEKWWIDSQRQANKRNKSACDFSLEGLIANIEAMIVLLERQQLHTHVPFFKLMLAKLQGQLLHAARLGKAPPQLQPSPVKGDWRKVAEQCSWKVTGGHYQDACRLLYSLLLWNADLLPENVMLMRHPDSLTSTIDQLQALISYMQQFGRLLATSPINWRQADYFFKAADEVYEILEPFLDEESIARGVPRSLLRRRRLGGIRGTRGAHRGDDVHQERSKPKRKPKLFPGHRDAERELVVTNMVKLKYGADTLITPAHIVEAEKSLSCWMAAKRSAMGTGAKQDERASVEQFTNSYLTGGIVLGLRPSIQSQGEGDSGGGGLAPLNLSKVNHNGWDGQDDPMRQTSRRSAGVGGGLASARLPSISAR